MFMLRHPRANYISPVWTSGGAILDPLNPYLYAIYKFSSSGNLLVDTANGNTLTNYASTAYDASGKSGGAASFNGSTQYLGMPLPGAAPRYTMASLWYYANSDAGGLVGGMDAGTNYNLTAYMNGSSTLTAQLRVGSAYKTVTKAAITGAWTHLFLACDDTQKKFWAYLNNVAFTSSPISYTGSPDNWKAATVIAIGAGEPAWNFMAGKVDEAYFWHSDAVSFCPDPTAVVAALYKAGAGAFYVG